MKYIITNSMYKYRAVTGVFVVLAIMAVALASSDVSATGQSIAERNVQGWISQLSQDPSAPSVREAQSKLERSGDSAVNGLVQSLGSSNPMIRRNAAEVLGYIGSPRALDPLTRTLAKDTDPGVRLEAAWALSGLNDTAVLNPLERASMLDADPHVRQAAGEAIEGLRWTIAQSANRDVKLVNALAVAPSQQSTVYLGVDHEILRSENGGKVWTSRGEMPSAVTALSVSPSDPDVIFAGTGSNGLYKSTDGGRVWSSIGGSLGEAAWIPVRVTAIAVDPNHANRVLIAKGTFDSYQQRLYPLGVSISQDGGRAWRGIDLANSPEAITRLFISEDRLYGLAGEQIFASPLPSD